MFIFFLLLVEFAVICILSVFICFVPRHKPSRKFLQGPYSFGLTNFSPISWILLVVFWGRILAGKNQSFRYNWHNTNCNISSSHDFRHCIQRKYSFWVNKWRKSFSVVYGYFFSFLRWRWVYVDDHKTPKVNQTDSTLHWTCNYFFQALNCSFKLYF